MIILIASLSVMVSFMIANQLTFLKPPEKGQKVPTIEKIKSTVEDPDATVFNRDAINPTVQTVIGGSSSGE